ncbi:MAG TPA: hypothetical protein VFQ61_32910 [Polyangiaceae bacterium]|nr:hypothetical protein [Polyangiaceae bacterium]
MASPSRRVTARRSFERYGLSLGVRSRRGAGAVALGDLTDEDTESIPATRSALVTLCARFPGGAASASRLSVLA